MAESSWPWDGVSDGDAALLAPYDEQEWDDNERMKFGSGGDVGVLTRPYSLNMLEVSEHAAGADMSVDVDTGAALVYGKRYKNTATVNLAIASNSSGNDRIDRVVVVWNRQATTYTGVTPNISPKTCRVAVLQGTPSGSPTPPAMTQNASTVYMIPLAQVYVANGAGSITDSNITDERSFAQASCGMEMIEQQIMDAASAVVTFNNIPQRFRNLKVVVYGRGTGVASTIPVFMRFNNDSGNNYRNIQQKAQNATMTVSCTTGDTQLDCGEITASTGLANAAGAVVIEIPNYRGTTFFKSMQAMSHAASVGSTTTIALYANAGWWDSIAAITRLDIFPGSGQFDAGSVLTLYGLL